MIWLVAYVKLLLPSKIAIEFVVMTSPLLILFTTLHPPTVMKWFLTTHHSGCCMAPTV